MKTQRRIKRSRLNRGGTSKSRKSSRSSKSGKSRKSDSSYVKVSSKSSSVNSSEYVVNKNALPLGSKCYRNKKCASKYCRRTRKQQLLFMPGACELRHTSSRSSKSGSRRYTRGMRRMPKTLKQAYKAIRKRTLKSRSKVEKTLQVDMTPKNKKKHDKYVGELSHHMFVKVALDFFVETNGVRTLSETILHFERSREKKLRTFAKKLLRKSSGYKRKFGAAYKEAVRIFNKVDINPEDRDIA